MHFLVAKLAMSNLIYLLAANSLLTHYFYPIDYPTFTTYFLNIEMSSIEETNQNSVWSIFKAFNFFGIYFSINPRFFKVFLKDLLVIFLIQNFIAFLLFKIYPHQKQTVLIIVFSHFLTHRPPFISFLSSAFTDQGQLMIIAL